MINRKLVRPNLAEVQDRRAHPRTLPGVQVPPTQETGSQSPPAAARRRQVPPEQTCAEAFYYLKQMNNRTPMVVTLEDGEQLRGQIEWYDKTCIKVNREGDPNLLVYKHSIKYMHKANEGTEANEGSED